MAQAKSTAAENASNDVAEQIANLKADIAQLSNAMAELGRAKGDEFRGYARTKAEEARAKAHDGADYMRENAEMAYSKANDFVVERPGAALGIAAAVGFLIGHFSARK